MPADFNSPATMPPLNLQSIEAMDGHRFEELIETLLRKMGFQVEGHKPAADGGIDIVAHNTEPFAGGRFIIQCKRQGSTISESVVRDLYGVVTDQRANKGVIVTNADFSAAAVKFAGGKPLELIDGPALLRLLAKHFEAQVPPAIPRLSLHHEALYRGLAEEIEDLLNAYRPIIAGSTFRQGKSCRTVKGFVSFVVERSTHIEAFSGSLGGLLHTAIEVFEQNQRASGFDPGRHVARSRALLRENFREILKSFQAAYFIDVPPAFIPLKTSLLDTYNALFETLDHVRKQFLHVVASPEKHLLPDGTADVNLDAAHRAKLAHCGFRMNEEAKKLSAPARPCFVATAVYQNADALPVLCLRRFRDERLAPFVTGRALIRCYYGVGPVLAAAIERWPVLRPAFRTVLDRLVRRIERDDC